MQAARVNTVNELRFGKTRMCWYYPQCINGVACPFAHGVAELRPKPCLAKTRICIPWCHGKCPLDAHLCRYAHGTQELRGRALGDEPEAPGATSGGTDAAETPGSGSGSGSGEVTGTAVIGHGGPSDDHAGGELAETPGSGSGEVIGTTIFKHRGPSDDDDDDAGAPKVDADVTAIPPVDVVPEAPARARIMDPQVTATLHVWHAGMCRHMGLPEWDEPTAGEVEEYLLEYMPTLYVD